jgi:hypothetical protein
MQNRALRKVRELSADTRHAMEGILGRSLQEDEAVSITTYKLAPRAKAREEASRHLLERIDKQPSESREFRKSKSTRQLMKPRTTCDTILNENHSRYGNSRSYECERLRDRPGVYSKLF